MEIQAKTITINTAQKIQLFDLTQEVKNFLIESSIWNGMGVISTLHTTTGIFFTETQDALWEDVEAFLHRLVDDDAYYRHNDSRFSDCDRKNAAAHLRALFLGGSLALQVEEGRLVLGQFQRIIFAELDGPRSRSLRMQFMGGGMVATKEILPLWERQHDQQALSRNGELG
ncbi:MAG: secondary thiamine-phosphate synthase enzyme YjbQ [Candidatus Binatia bacterium]